MLYMCCVMLCTCVYMYMHKYTCIYMFNCLRACASTYMCMYVYGVFAHTHVDYFQQHWGSLVVALSTRSAHERLRACKKSNVGRTRETANKGATVLCTKAPREDRLLGMVGLMSFFRNSCQLSLWPFFANVNVIFFPLDDTRSFDFSGTTWCANPPFRSCSRIHPSNSLTFTL